MVISGGDQLVALDGSVNLAELVTVAGLADFTAAGTTERLVMALPWVALDGLAIVIVEMLVTVAGRVDEGDGPRTFGWRDVEHWPATVDDDDDEEAFWEEDFLDPFLRGDYVVLASCFSSPTSLFVLINLSRPTKPSKL